MYIQKILRSRLVHIFLFSFSLLLPNGSSSHENHFTIFLQDINLFNVFQFPVNAPHDPGSLLALFPPQRRVSTVPVKNSEWIRRKGGGIGRQTEEESRFVSRQLAGRNTHMFLSRRQFLKASAGTVAVAALADQALALTALQPVIEVGNPLGDYPDRSWERVYHDQYRYDSSFTWCCSPNDTHGCR